MLITSHCHFCDCISVLFGDPQFPATRGLRGASGKGAAFILPQPLGTIGYKDHTIL